MPRLAALSEEMMCAHTHAHTHTHTHTHGPPCLCARRLCAIDMCVGDVGVCMCNEFGDNVTCPQVFSRPNYTASPGRWRVKTMLATGLALWVHSHWLSTLARLTSEWRLLMIMW